MKDRVSVVIPTYNRSRLVRRAVESALAAVSQGDEILVIDDGSTDDTEEILRPYFGKIRYLHLENSGPGAARNQGIRLATHPLVAFPDSDDEWTPDKLYLQRAIMDAFPEVVFCFSDLLSRHDDGKLFNHVLAIWQNDSAVGHENSRASLDEVLGSVIPFSSIATLPKGRPDFHVHTGYVYSMLMEAYCVWTCSIMVRKESAGDAFLFPEKTRIFEEWECFAKLAKKGVAAYLGCELAIQNVHHEARLTDTGEIRKATARIELLHHIWGADYSFLRAHSSLYRDVLKMQHLRRARYLIREGKMGQAKNDLKIADGPWSYRLLTNLPSPLVGTLLGLRRKLFGGMTRTGSN